MQRPPEPAASPPGALTGACVLLAAAVAYLVVTAGSVPLPRYLPVESRWVVGAPPAGAIAMDWYARALATLASAALAAPVARALAARTVWARRPRAAAVIFGLAFGAMGWAVVYTVLALASAPRAGT